MTGQSEGTRSHPGSSQVQGTGDVVPKARPALGPLGYPAGGYLAITDAPEGETPFRQPPVVNTGKPLG